VICNIGNWRARRDHAKPRIEGSKLAQKRLEGRLTEPSLLLTGRILERLQPIQNKQGSPMPNELCESLAFLPCCPELWIWIAKPAKSRIKKFIGRRSAAAGALSVERPAKYELRRTIVFSSHPSKPMVNERGFADPGPGNDCNDVRRMSRKAARSISQPASSRSGPITGARQLTRPTITSSSAN